jgi:hypothetical protein
MMELHPTFLMKNDRKECAVLPYAEYVAVCELLDDMRDLIDLRHAKEVEGGSPTIGLEELKLRLGLDHG